MPKNDWFESLYKAEQYAASLEYPLNKEDFSAALLYINDVLAEDREMRHMYLDIIIAGQLEGLGYEEGISVFRSTDKWYA